MRAESTSYRGETFSERMRSAPCATTDPELGFPNQGQRRGEDGASAYDRALALCAGCPLDLKAECLEIAMRNEGRQSGKTRYGVFGGLDPDARAALARERAGVAA